MTTNHNDRAAEIQARLDAATPGPWEPQRSDNVNGRLVYEVGPAGRAPVALALYDAECKDVALWAALGG